MQTDIIAVQKVFYNQNPPFGYQWLLVMSTQLVSVSIPRCHIPHTSPPSNRPPHV